MNTHKYMNGIIEKSAANKLEPQHWLPIMEYAQRSGISVSTLRRKIKANEIAYKMEEGRYLLRFDIEDEIGSFRSTDETPVQQQEKSELHDLIRQAKEENALQWRALEARVVGLSRKLEMYAEQMSELKMLVKIFEEKLDAHQ